MKQLLLVPELRELLASEDVEPIRHLIAESHPAIVAELISGLEAGEIWRVLHLLPVKDRAEVFSHFDLDQQVELATGQNRRDMARLLEEMEPDERADLVQQLDEKVQGELLPLVAKAEREDIRKLVSYAEGTAGSVMTTDYAVLRPGIAISQALEQIRIQAPGKATIYYIYVVDAQHRLVGFVSLKDLILARPAQTVEEIMHSDVISVGVNDDQEVAARSIEKYDLIAIPVVSDDNVLVGIVTHDDAMDILRQEQQEDIEKFMAISGRHAAGEYLKTPAWVHFKNRAYWIVGLAALGLVSGLIIHGYEATLMNLLILALYMPMVADTGGNTGSQSATVVVRALALGEVSPRDVLRVIFKEFKIALLLALILGVLSFAKVMWLSAGSEIKTGFSLGKIGLAIAVALSLQVITATLIGALLPLGAAKMKWDPAVVASPALTTIVDITGLLIYFTTAKLILGI
ncbi:MAG: magnesium transporter [Planctomycetaceae bacterium]|nr:magnesium transporter [Planctomycetaceae bacterium]